MEYSQIKIFFMAIVLVVAFSIFFVRIKKLIGLMKSVTGKSEFVFDRVVDRIAVLFSDVLGQSNVRRKFIPGLAHTLIFFGFLSVQPHSLQLMIQGVFPMFDPGPSMPILYSVYLYGTEILAAFVLVGLGVGLYRRIVVRPSYLTLSLDANLIILFTSVIIFTFFAINVFHLGLPNKSGFNYNDAFPISSWIAGLLNLSGWSKHSIFLGYEISYYFHMATILGFLMYVPGSKHLHLLAAAPNVFLKPLEPEKVIVKTDIEDENAETFGLGKVSEMNWKDVLGLYSCTECGRCEELCPASNTGKPLSPKKWIHDLKDDLLEQSSLVLAKKYEEVKPIIRENSGITSDVLWSCTTCRACEDICPVNIQPLDTILEVRKYQTLMESDFPEELKTTFANLETQSNPWGFSADTRADWSQGLEVPLMTDNPEADLLYFVGCSGSFDDRGKKIAQSMARVLNKAGVNFAILGQEEKCNGDMARRAGNEYLAQTMIQANVEILNQYKPKKIISGCPHCFNMIKNEYPIFGAKYEVVHHTQFINELIQEGRLKVKKSIENVTYHDSCYLGRWNQIYEQPREIIRSVSRNQQVVEMQRNRSKGFCCGAGGTRMFMEETLGKRINHERAEEVIRTQAETVSTACPFCTTMLTDGIKDQQAENKVRVKDVAELIDEATN